MKPGCSGDAVMWLGGVAILLIIAFVVLWGFMG